MNKILARTMMLTALAGLCLAVLPSASAQAQPQGQFQVGSVTPCAAITVNSGSCSVKIPWTYTYGPGLPLQPTGAVAQSATLTWVSPVCPSGVTMVGALTTNVPLGDNAQSTKAITGNSDFAIFASPDAAGEKQLTCTITGSVSATAGGAVTKSADSTGQVALTVKYYGLLTATIPTTIAEAGPQKEIRYDITLTNLGNANTNVNFALGTDAPPNWSPVAPSPIIIGPSQQSGGADFTRPVTFQVSTPHKNGWNNDQTAFQLKITPSSTINPDQKGNEIAINVLARVRGIYVPGPEPFLLVAALLGTALVARTMRKSE